MRVEPVLDIISKMLEKSIAMNIVLELSRLKEAFC